MIWHIYLNYVQFLGVTLNSNLIDLNIIWFTCILKKYSRFFMKKLDKLIKEFEEINQNEAL